ncbi:hypothetical protein SAMN00017477_0892 [Peptoniphilus asaccharolyticus DSM 20463]|uniref:Uncharacterized protein n=1 Tax=Peptoniphilus asaccharolyticus DSM 20463 TaxID=573058 RepID=A0A1W1UZ60_PEPAS|nr:hypothetical protein SAMN00017477_0892 [Peptoniphilus asaccharolyticus DSM 20463]
MILYLGVTTDEFELPLCVSDTAAELARMYGMTPNAVYCNIYNNQDGTRNGIKFLRIEVEDETHEKENP